MTALGEAQWKYALITTPGQTWARLLAGAHALVHKCEHVYYTNKPRLGPMLSEYWSDTDLISISGQFLRVLTFVFKFDMRLRPPIIYRPCVSSPDLQSDWLRGCRLVRLWQSTRWMLLCPHDSLTDVEVRDDCLLFLIDYRSPANCYANVLYCWLTSSIVQILFTVQ